MLIPHFAHENTPQIDVHILYERKQNVDWA